MDDMQIGRQAGKDGGQITDILVSGQRLNGYGGDHSTTTEVKKKLGIAQTLHDLFLEKEQLCAAEVEQVCNKPIDRQTNTLMDRWNDKEEEEEN